VSREQQDGLNPQQRRAVTAGTGPILVLAGPGSGKTRVLTQRITHLIRQRAIDPRHILAVTFTNKAAREMRERLSEPLSVAELDRLTVGTFHAICANLLRREIQHLGRSRDYVIYDSDDQERLMKRVLRELNLDEKRHPPRAVLARISGAKNELVDAEEYRRVNRTYGDEIVGRCYQRYQSLLVEANALDFDDLLSETVRLLREHPAVLERLQRRFQQILVDEYQDTNRAQYMLVRLLAGSERNLFVVGDDAQSIYGWRGADIRNILQFEQDYPDAEVILLEQNYRSTQTILDGAQALMRAGVQRKHLKQLWSDRGEGLPLTLYEAYDESEEAGLVAAEIQRLHRTAAVPLSDFAILYRTNHQSRAIEDALMAQAIPYQVVGGTRFYERREIRDLLAYLRLIANPADSISLLRVINWPTRGIGESSVARLLARAAAQAQPLFAVIAAVADGGEPDGLTPRVCKALGALTTLLRELMTLGEQRDLAGLFDVLLERLDFRAQLKSDYGEEEGAERWANIEELYSKVAAYAGLPRTEQLATFLQEVALVTGTDDDTQPDRVTCITLHQVKGLEYRHVFIVGLEEGLLPHSRSQDDRDQLEEERRLLYVGMTRAEQRLYLSYAGRRTSFGRTTPSRRSRFLDDLPAAMLRKGGRPSTGVGRAGTAPRPSLSLPRADRVATTAAVELFEPGDQVFHATFGAGVVISCRPIDGDAEVVVRFGEKERRLLAGFARLERRS
jgi:DNA helicase II / ATP-dependent DNA helicase PcrA